MRASVLLCVLLAVIAPGAAAFTVFVTSSPPGAAVAVNGVELSGRTPVVHRGEGALVARVEVRLPGYRPAVTRAVASPGEATWLDLELEPDFVLTGFPEEPGLIRLQGEYPPARFVRIPRGTYTVGREEGKIILTPRYPRDSLIGGVSIGAGVALGTVAASLFRDGEAQADSRISAATIVSGAAALALVIADVVLIADRGRYLASLEPVVVDADPVEGRVLLDRADFALETGSLAVALDSLDAYVRGNPDGPRVAESLYRQARILVSLGRYDEAIARYESLMTTYPDPEFYDRAVVGFAETAGRTGRPEAGIDALELVTFVGATPTREEIDLRRAELYGSLSGDERVAAARADAWLTLVVDYPDAADRDFYRLTAADALVDAGRPDDARGLLDEIDALDQALRPLYDAVRERLLDYE